MVKISLTTDAVIFYKSLKGLQVLLIKRKNKPFQGEWALPGGFLEPDELLIEGCKRELKEETGLEIEKLTQVGIYDEIHRDPRGRTISIAFTGLLTESKLVIASDDAADAQWKPVKYLQNLAFDHQTIIKDALKVLQIQA